MAKKRVTRKELLKGPDEFLSFSEKAAHFIREHNRECKIIGWALAAILLIYLGIHTGIGYINKKGQSAYNMAYSLISTQNTDLNPESEELKRSAELFQKVLDDYGLSKASRLALPELAYVKMVEKKYDEAIHLYQEFLDKAPNHSPYQSLAQIAIASCHEAKGEYEQAVEILNQVMAQADDLFKEQALFNLARIHRLAGQKEKAREILEEFVEKYQNSPFLPLAKAQLQDFPS
jgi:tetratricopeptide (TPR) repeat protein